MIRASTSCGESCGENLIPAGRMLQPQDPVAVHKGVDQRRHPRPQDRQRATRPRLQLKVELGLTSREALPCHGLQQLQLDLVMRRPDVLHRPRPAPVGVHDLHPHAPPRRSSRCARTWDTTTR
jgi:hypothetical protein